ncbi:MAG: DUF4258 domain-containing protein [Deltaproteobacteria bacterium]
MIESFSKHALQRASQRNITWDNVNFIMRFGREIHNGGALFVFLGKHDIPYEYQRDDRFAKLEGSTLLISDDGKCLITTYKNKNGLKQIKKKQKQ